MNDAAPASFSPCRTRLHQPSLHASRRFSPDPAVSLSGIPLALPPPVDWTRTDDLRRRRRLFEL